MVALAIELAGCQPEKSPDVSPPPGKTPTEVPSDDRRELVVAISIDIPPYVMNQTTSGLEIDVLHEALPEYKLRFLQMSYAELQTAIQDDKSDVSAGVHRTDDGGIYSRGFVSFANYAITKKSATQKIDNIADLQGHVVLTWEDADE